jgi:hypothetical protein
VPGQAPPVMECASTVAARLLEYRRLLDFQPKVKSGSHQHDADQKWDPPAILEKGLVGVSEGEVGDQERGAGPRKGDRRAELWNIAYRPRRPDGAYSAISSVASAHSPPTANPCANRNRTNKDGGRDPDGGGPPAADRSTRLTGP